MKNSFPTSVEIFDDTMREGLQIESPEISVDDKLRLLDAIGDMGAKTISIGSFAHPDWTPSMAKIDEIAKRFNPKPGVKYTALVFNKKGFERADAYYPKIDVRSSGYLTHVELCDTFARRNYNRTQKEQFKSAEKSVERAVAAKVIEGEISLGNPFGSNFEGPFSLQQRIDLFESLLNIWRRHGIEVTKVSFLDAMGWNLPHTIGQTIEAIREKVPSIRTFRMHLHNTRGATMASYYEALRLGVTQFDTSLGGLGGCPYCGNGRAAGHLPTEDFVHLCNELGIETGYDLDKVIEAALLAEEIIGRPLKGHVSKSGPLPKEPSLYPADMPFVESIEEAAHFRLGTDVYKDQRFPWKNRDILTGSQET